MNDCSEIHRGDDRCQRQQHFRAVDGDDRHHQGEDAERSKTHDHVDDLIGDFSQPVEEVINRFGFGADHRDADAKEDGKYDNLQHVAFFHRDKRIGGNDVDQHVLQRRSQLGSGFGAGGDGEAFAWLHQGAEHQADRYGEGGCRQVEHHDLDADASQFFDIADRSDTGNDGSKHDRHDDHFDQVDEDGADGGDPDLHPGDGSGAGDQTADDTKNQADENFYR